MATDLTHRPSSWSQAEIGFTGPMPKPPMYRQFGFSGHGDPASARWSGLSCSPPMTSASMREHRARSRLPCAAVVLGPGLDGGLGRTDQGRGPRRLGDGAGAVAPERAARSPPPHSGCQRRGGRDEGGSGTQAIVQRQWWLAQWTIETRGMAGAVGLAEGVGETAGRDVGRLAPVQTGLRRPATVREYGGHRAVASGGLDPHHRRYDLGACGPGAERAGPAQQGAAVVGDEGEGRVVGAGVDRLGA